MISRPRLPGLTVCVLLTGIAFALTSCGRDSDRVVAAPACQRSSSELHVAESSTDAVDITCLSLRQHQHGRALVTLSMRARNGGSYALTFTGRNMDVPRDTILNAGGQPKVFRKLRFGQKSVLQIRLRLLSVKDSPGVARLQDFTIDDFIHTLAELSGCAPLLFREFTPSVILQCSLGVSLVIWEQGQRVSRLLAASPPPSAVVQLMYRAKPPPMPTSTAMPTFSPPTKKLTTTVAANAGWIDTGIDLPAGSAVYLAASGTVRVSDSKRPMTPAGRPDCTTTPAYPGSGWPCDALVAYVGSSSRTFLIGSSSMFVVQVPGRLHLAVNAPASDVAHNSGSWNLDQLIIFSFPPQIGPPPPSAVPTPTAPPRLYWFVHPSLLSLQLSDLPAGYVEAQRGNLTPREAARFFGAALPDARRHQVVVGFAARFASAGGSGAGLRSIREHIITFLRPAGAQWGYQRLLGQLSSGEGSAMSSGALGEENEAWIARNSLSYDPSDPASTAGTAVTALFRRGQYVVRLDADGVTGTFAPQQILALAWLVDERLGQLASHPVTQVQH